MNSMLIGVIIGLIIGVIIGANVSGDDINIAKQKIKGRSNKATFDTDIKQPKKEGFLKRIFTKKNKDD